ncbi:hypothetical protein RFI_04547 [Reticulomyxa filosa]|uniref:Uncharacterized protein n=1 Tax=Reticulomyxa filosa TaxID=46433 RepID=X6P1Z7_RETFI|nr:hypothetical protein RFI_04547 [Reticulomyxa filosa]|eukprot:ETO32570.1 hypothetical protein RFI_04547 [Reticulomyxa filosa]
MDGTLSKSSLLSFQPEIAIEELNLKNDIFNSPKQSEHTVFPNELRMTSSCELLYNYVDDILQDLEWLIKNAYCSRATQWLHQVLVNNTINLLEIYYGNIIQIFKRDEQTHVLSFKTFFVLKKFISNVQKVSLMANLYYLTEDLVIRMKQVMASEIELEDEIETFYKKLKQLYNEQIQHYINAQVSNAIEKIWLSGKDNIPERYQVPDITEVHFLFVAFFSLNKTKKELLNLIEQVADIAAVIRTHWHIAVVNPVVEQIIENLFFLFSKYLTEDNNSSLLPKQNFGYGGLKLFVLDVKTLQTCFGAFMKSQNQKNVNDEFRTNTNQHDDILMDNLWFENRIDQLLKTKPNFKLVKQE